MPGKVWLQVGHELEARPVGESQPGHCCDDHGAVGEPQSLAAVMQCQGTWRSCPATTTTRLSRSKPLAGTCASGTGPRTSVSAVQSRRAQA